MARGRGDSRPCWPGLREATQLLQLTTETWVMLALIQGLARMLLLLRRCPPKADRPSRPRLTCRPHHCMDMGQSHWRSSPSVSSAAHLVLSTPMAFAALVLVEVPAEGMQLPAQSRQMNDLTTCLAQ